MDIGLVAAMITSVDRNPLPKVLFDCWDEWAAQTSKTSKGKIGGSKAPGQWTTVVALRSWNLLHVDFMLPEIMRNQSLSNTVGIQCGIFPVCSGISVHFTPVAVPARRSIVILSRSKLVRLRLETFWKVTIPLCQPSPCRAIQSNLYSTFRGASCCKRRISRSNCCHWVSPCAE